MQKNYRSWFLRSSQLSGFAGQANAVGRGARVRYPAVNARFIQLLIFEKPQKGLQNGLHSNNVDICRAIVIIRNIGILVLCMTKSLVFCLDL